MVLNRSLTSGEPFSGNKWFVVVDGNEGKRYDGIGERSLRFSPDGKRLAYMAGAEGKVFFVVDGKEDKYYELSEKVKNSFNKQYTQQFDVIDTKDLSFRPNQIFLVSLDFTMIDEHLQKKIVNDVKVKLLTIFGLRTLSVDDTRYKGKYIGDYNKDIAYHNGTIWPWLIGPFVKAYLKMEKYSPESRKYAYNNFIKPMINVFNDKWDGSINEIFDGDPIYAPEGCITQAWSVAELLRTCIEDM